MNTPLSSFPLSTTMNTPLPPFFKPWSYEAPIPATWNMSDAAWSATIYREFYWEVEDITPQVLETLIAQHNANRLALDLNDEPSIMGPLIVCISVPDGKVLLMIVHKLDRTSVCLGKTKGRGKHSVALVTQDLTLVEIPSHLPTMVIPQWGEQLVTNHRVNPHTWWFPSLRVVIPYKKQMTVQWTLLREVLQLPKYCHTSDILHRLVWPENDQWSVAPAYKLVFNRDLLYSGRGRSRSRTPKSCRHMERSSSRSPSPTESESSSRSRSRSPPRRRSARCAAAKERKINQVEGKITQVVELVERLAEEQASIKQQIRELADKL